MGVGDHVDAALCLERAHAQVAVQRADLVDPDHLRAPRREQVGVHARLDPPLVPEQLRRERAGGLPLADTGGPVEEVGVRRTSFTADASSSRASGCSANALKLTVDPLRQGVGVERPVEHDHALGEQRCQLLVAGGDALVERGVLALDPIGLRADAQRGRPRSIESTNVRSGSSPRSRARSPRAPRRPRGRARFPGRRSSCRDSGRAGRPRRARARAADPATTSAREAA